MSRLLALAGFVLAVSTPFTALADVHWRRAVVAEEVAITVHTVGELKLASLMGGNDPHALIDKGSRESRQGYAVLYRNRVTGAYSCAVYVTEGATEETLEHERRHCHGWTHD